MKNTVLGMVDLEQQQRTLLVLFFLNSLMLLPMSVLGHGVANDRIEKLNQQIILSPNEAGLYIKRGRVHADVQHWHAALDDYLKALQVNPDNIEPHYWIAKAYVQQEKYSLAKAHIEKYVRHYPQSPLGFETLALIERKFEHWDLAAKNYEEAISKSIVLKPHLVIQTIQVLMKMDPVPIDDIDRLIATGIETHGPLVTYVDIAVQANQKALRFNEALNWIERLPANLKSIPDWLLIKANLLEASGQKESAIETYQAVINRYGLLPKHRQSIPAKQVMLKQAQSALERLTSEPLSFAD